MVTSEAPAPVKSLYPRAGHHRVRFTHFAHSLAERVASGRATPGPSASFHAHLKTYLPHLSEEDREKLFQEFWALLALDGVQDSEERQARRAVWPILKSHLHLLQQGLPLKEELLITGWLPGASVRKRRETFTLTGDACPRCEVNPLAHGAGGGLRCLDTTACGWWYCA